MNSSEHFPPTYTAVAKQNIDSYPDAGRELVAEVPTDLPVRPTLFLAWSNARQVGDCSPDQADVDLNWEHSPTPARSKWRDRGLWLLRGALARQDGWSRLNALPMAVFFPNRISRRDTYAVAKRAIDVVGSLALLILLTPLLLLVAALVRIDSPGPALFRQRRIGKDGKQFQFWKFRSMRVDAPKYAPSPTSDLDWRLTRIGRLIRRISIDELPQLINVLQGEMSLVGPRPEMPFIVDRYTPLERARLAAKPGITGLWQISPARALPIHENLQYDLHYIAHQSLVLDGAILLRTVAAVIRGVGAV